MRCPKCSNRLKMVRSRGAEVDICSHCRGIWFDHGELVDFVKRLSESDKVQPEESVLFKRREVDIAGQRGQDIRHCPKCQTAMRVFNYAYDSNVFLDRCPACDGLWTDRGEAIKIARYLKADPRSEAVGRAMADHGRQVSQINHTIGMGSQMQGAWLRLWFAPRLVIPYRDDQPCGIFPWVTVALIVLCVAVFGVQLTVSNEEAFIHRFGFKPANFWGVGLLTSMFLHGDALHLLGNMFFLWLFGDNVEERLGRLRFVGLWLACELGSAVAYTLANLGSTIPCVGASGALSGVMGAYLVFFPRANIKTYVWGYLMDVPVLVYLGGWFLLQLFAIHLEAHGGGGGVAWWSHVGGFVCGVLLALIATRLRPQTS